MINKQLLTYIDKDQWSLGLWTSEPDEVSWIDPEAGYLCLIKRIDYSGHLCGYVAIDKDHYCYNYNLDALSVHGGVTYAENEIHSKLISDVKDKWWIGFDCNHGNDLTPRDWFGKSTYATYKDISYVTKQVCRLVQQLKELDEDILLKTFKQTIVPLKEKLKILQDGEEKIYELFQNRWSKIDELK